MAGFNRLALSSLVIAVVGLCAAAAVRAVDSPARRVQIKDLGGKVEVKIDGKLFTEYHYKGYAKPILYPVIGPGNVPMTRNYPMKKGVKGEATDHRHHTSLWYTHGDVNGHDFWLVGKGKGKIVQDGAAKVVASDSRAAIRTRNKWVAANGKVQCTDERTIAFLAVGRGRAIDYQITIKASEGDVTFGDTKEGTMAIRTNPVLRVTGPVAKGKCCNSEGVKGKAIWGKQAKWVDYWAPIGPSAGSGQAPKTVGVAIFDHPSNPRHPTRWHARTYGLVTANPFGLHHFARKPKGTGNMIIKAGKSVTFRYRFLFHSGDVKEAKIAERYEEFAKTKGSTDKK